MPNPVNVAGTLVSLTRIAGPNPTMTGTDMQHLVSTLFSYTSGLSNTLGTTLGNAQLLTAAINEVSTNATTATAFMLPIALPGQTVQVINDGAQTITIFGNANNPNNSSTTDTVAAHGATVQAGATTGVTQASGAVANYTCFATGKWKQFLTS